MARTEALLTSPAGAKPLSAGSFGLSRRWDFWAMLVLAVAAFGILLYAGTRSG
jgi:hypothetical protein